MKGQGVLAYWFDLQQDVQAEWADWYIRDHMPSRLGATFTGARCFRAMDGQPGFMALYETPTPEALIAPEYMALLRNASEGDRRRRAWYLGTTRACCRKIADVGNGRGGVVASVRFSPKKAVGTNEAGAAIAEQLAKIERVGRVSYLEADPKIRATMDGARVTGHDDSAADRILIVECSSEGDAKDALARLSADGAWSALADEASINIACYRLLYSIAKED